MRILFNSVARYLKLRHSDQKFSKNFSRSNLEFFCLNHWFSSAWKYLKPPKNLSFWQNIVSVGLLKFCKHFFCFLFFILFHCAISSSSPELIVLPYRKPRYQSHYFIYTPCIYVRKLFLILIRNNYFRSYIFVKLKKKKHLCSINVFTSV